MDYKLTPVDKMRAFVKNDIDSSYLNKMDKEAA